MSIGSETTEEFRVNSSDEWSQLRRVVVGRAESLRTFDVDATFQAFYEENVGDFIRANGLLGKRYEVPHQYVEELCEDIDQLVDVLTQFGCIVERPELLPREVELETLWWRTIAGPALNVRDHTIVLGDCLLETAPHVRARLFENELLREIFLRAFHGGSRWLQMPRPTLRTRPHAESQLAAAAENADGSELRGPDLDIEMIFDGAQCIRLGADVIVNIGNVNHRVAFDWLARAFAGEFTFHRLEGLADNHIDSMLLPLRPGLFLARSEMVRAWIPEAFSDWDLVIAPEPSAAAFPDYGVEGLNLASRFVDMNVLSLDESTVVVNRLYPELCRLLEQLRFTVVPVRHRHRRLFSGGFHCFTLDLVRDSGSPTRSTDRSVTSVVS